MIPILFEKDATTFTNNGVCRMRDCGSCIVTEERNGIYECDFTYPVSAEKYSEIYPGRIIYAETDKKGRPQPFDIVGYSKPIDGMVSFHAVHVSYRLNKVVARGTSISSLADAFTMLWNGVPANSFVYQTDKVSTGNMAAADGVPRTVKSMIGGVEGSILDSYGGELEWDGFTVVLHSQRGQQRDIPIRYGLNLSDYKEDADYSEAYTACVPYWSGSASDDSGDVIVVGSMISSGTASYDGRVDCMPLDVSDKFETQPTVAQVEAEGLRYMQASQSSLPTQSIEVSFVDLRDTLEYQGLAPLLEFGLCDTVPVVFPRYGMNGYFKIVKTVYNVLSERYDSMELGALSTTLKQALGLEKQR